MRFYEPNPTYAGIVFFSFCAVPLDIKFFTEFRLRLKSGFEKSFTEVKKMCEKNGEKLLVILVIYDAHTATLFSYTIYLSALVHAIVARNFYSFTE